MRPGLSIRLLQGVQLRLIVLHQDRIGILVVFGDERSQCFPAFRDPHVDDEQKMFSSVTADAGTSHVIAPCLI